MTSECVSVKVTSLLAVGRLPSTSERTEFQIPRKVRNCQRQMDASSQLCLDLSDALFHFCPLSLALFPIFVLLISLSIAVVISSLNRYPTNMLPL